MARAGYRMALLYFWIVAAAAGQSAFGEIIIFVAVAGILHVLSGGIFAHPRTVCMAPCPVWQSNPASLEFLRVEASINNTPTPM